MHISNMHFIMAKKHKISAILSPISKLIFDKVNKVKPHGWFTKFMNDELVEHYGKNFELKINIDYLVDITKKRNKLDEEIKQIKEKIKKVKK